MPNRQCVAVTRAGSKYVFVFEFIFEYRNVVYLLLCYCYEMKHSQSNNHPLIPLSIEQTVTVIHSFMQRPVHRTF